LKPGDKVIRGGSRISIVDKITSSQIVTKEGYRYKRGSGVEVGGSGRIEAATPEEIATVEQKINEEAAVRLKYRLEQEAKNNHPANKAAGMIQYYGDRLCEFDPTKLPADELQAIAARLKEILGASK
jgi:putative IMPACT (imprinted ancient) family translation regulator